MGIVIDALERPVGQMGAQVTARRAGTMSRVLVDLARPRRAAVGKLNQPPGESRCGSHRKSVTFDLNVLIKLAQVVLESR